jgi:hypothetical protein
LTNRLDQIGAGRSFDPGTQQTAQYDNRKPVRRDKSGTTICRPEVSPMLQLHDVIEVERADAEIIANLCGRYDGVDGFVKRENVDGNAIDGKIWTRLRLRFQHVDILMTMWPRCAFTEADGMPTASATGTACRKLSSTDIVTK